MMEFHAEIEMQEQKVGRGGAREGAGRKRKDVHYYGTSCFTEKRAIWMLAF